MGISMEIVVPNKECNAEEFMEIIRRMGAEFIGGYGIKEGRYIKGAKYEGGNLVKIGELYFLIIVDNNNGNVRLENIVLTSAHVLTSKMPVVITGSSGSANGEKILFACKDDAIEWMSTLQTSQILKLSVKDGDYYGSAVMYL